MNRTTYTPLPPYRGMTSRQMMEFCRRFNVHDDVVRRGSMDGPVDYFLAHPPKLEIHPARSKPS